MRINFKAVRWRVKFEVVGSPKFKIVPRFESLALLVKFKSVRRVKFRSVRVKLRIKFNSSRVKFRLSESSSSQCESLASPSQCESSLT